jgi:hypothetical protein
MKPQILFPDGKAVPFDLSQLTLRNGPSGIVLLLIDPADKQARPIANFYGAFISTHVLSSPATPGLLCVPAPAEG